MMNSNSQEKDISSGVRDLFTLLLTGLLLFSCNPDKAKSPVNENPRIDSLMEIGEFEEALRVVDSCMQHFPSDPSFCLRKAICLDALQKPAEAISYFDNALEHSSLDSCKLRKSIYEHRAFVLRHSLNRSREAYHDYISAHGIGLQCPPVLAVDSLLNLYNAGFTALDLNDFLVADSIAQVFLNRHPNAKDGHLLRAETKLREGKYELAIAEYDILIKGHQQHWKGNTASFHFDRGFSFHAIGDLKSACADWQKALDLGLKEAKPKLDSFCSGS